MKGIKEAKRIIRSNRAELGRIDRGKVNIEEYRAAIEEVKNRAVADEVRDRILYADNPEEEIEKMIGGDAASSLLNDDENIFSTLLEARRSELLLGISEALISIRRAVVDVTAIRVGEKDGRVFYAYGDFRSPSYEKAKRRYLKCRHRLGPAYLPVWKSRDVGARQRKLLSRILDEHTSADTIKTLTRYAFIDAPLADIVARAASLILGEATHYPVSAGDDFKRGVAFLRAA